MASRDPAVTRAETCAVLESRRPLRSPLWPIVGLACLVVVFVQYQAALDCFFVGDDLSFLFGNPGWLRDALTPSPTTWNYRPLNEIALHLSAAIAGLDASRMHTVNLLTHLAAGIGLYWLLARLGQDRRVCLIAPILFVSRGIGYGAVVWISTLSYLLTTVYALLTVAWWNTWLQGKGARYAVLTFGGFAVALLTIEHAVLLLPLYLLMDLLMGHTRSLQLPVVSARDDRPSVHRGIVGLARELLRYAPFVLLVAAFFGIKYASQHGLLMSSLPLPADTPAPIASGREVLSQLPPERMWLGIINTPWRASQDLLAGATYLFLPIGLAHGVGDTWLTRHAWLALPAYVAVIVWALWKGRPLTRLLIAWVHLYLLPMSLAGVPQARFHYMMMAPAAALMALAWVAVWDRFAAGRARRWAVAVSAILLVALVYGEAAFVHARLVEWKLASTLVRGAIAMLQQDVHGDVSEVRLVNFPVRAPGRFWPVPAFENATRVLTAAIQPPRPDVRVEAVYDRTFVGANWPTDGIYRTRDEIEGDLDRRELLTYEFLDSPPRIVRRR